MRIVQLLVAVTQPMQRVRLRSLGSETGLALVAEAATGMQAAELALEFNPDLILCDEQILNDPATELFCLRRKADNISRFVVVTSGTTAPPSKRNIPISGVLPVNMPPSAMREQLLAIYRTPMQRGRGIRQDDLLPKVITGLEDRFVIVSNPDLNASQNLSDQPAEAMYGAVSAAVEPVPAHATMRLSRDAGRRRSSALRDRLETLLAEAKSETHQQGERDSVTGLPTSKVMGRALKALTDAGCPSAIVVVQIWSTTPRAIDSRVITAAFRSTSGALQANVRRGDVVCRLDDMTFAVVMPGLERESDIPAVDRICTAVDGILQNHRSDDRNIRFATGTGYWSPPMSPTEPFEEAWRGMLANRRDEKSRTVTP